MYKSCTNFEKSPLFENAEFLKKQEILKNTEFLKKQGIFKNAEFLNITNFSKSRLLHSNKQQSILYRYMLVKSMYKNW